MKNGKKMVRKVGPLGLGGFDQQASLTGGKKVKQSPAAKKNLALFLLLLGIHDLKGTATVYEEER